MCEMPSFYFINCNVASHDNVTCFEYIRSFGYKSANKEKLKSLASIQKWRQCAIMKRGEIRVYNLCFVF